MKIKKGFTLIEILVVITLIGLIATIGLLSYVSLNKAARDSRRRGDLEQIRIALEQYRSNNNAYPTPISNSSGLNFGSGALSDSSNTYIQTVPQDPKSPQTYYYTATSSDYTLGSKLENSSFTCAAAGGNDDCDQTAGPQACNYCVGPYGQKQ